MRVLMLGRSNMGGGGEDRLARETARALRAQGVEVDFSDALTPDLNGTDVVHLFGLNQPAEPLLQARHAQRRGVPVVLSPAYQRLDEYNRRGRNGLAAVAYRVVRSENAIERLKLLLRLRRAAGRRGAPATLLGTPFCDQQRELLQHVRVLLPNSRLEAEAIRNDFRLTVPSLVVPNAVSSAFDAADPAAFTARYGLRDFVIAVGFITSLKNQIRLINALDGTGLRLVIVGGAVATHKVYYRAVRRLADRRQTVSMLGPIAHPALASALAAARVVALPSWFETCGLSCLEGALAGCRVAITSRGYTRDYFADSATYCDPDSVASIRQAVQAAAEQSAEELGARIRETYTWEAAAEATLEAYRLALSFDN